jgi:hypothetical protein
MSESKLKLLPSQQDVVNFYKELANEYGIENEDVNNIFNYEYEKLVPIKDRNIFVHIEEDRVINFEMNSNIIEVIGDNQVGKSTAIIYLANLLGYDFDKKENKQFLQENNIVDRGISIFNKIINRIKCEVKIVSDGKILNIISEKGEIKLSYFEEGYSIQEHYDSQTQTEAYRDSINKLINVQFISKGRDFVRQVLLDIITDLKGISIHINDLISEQISLIKIKNSELVDKATTVEGVDIYKARSRLSDEYTIEKRFFDVLNNDFQKNLLKVDTINRLLENTFTIESYNCFQLNKQFYDLQNEIDRLEKRRDILKQTKDNYDTLKSSIQKKEDEINSIKKEIESDEFFIQEIEKYMCESFAELNKIRMNFLNRENYEKIYSDLQENKIEYLMDIYKITDPKAKKAIEDIYSVVRKQDSDILLPNELWGNMEKFKKILDEKRKEILDNNRIIFACNNLIITLKTKDIYKDYEYNNIIEKVTDSNKKINEILGEITELKSILDTKSISSDEDRLKNSIEKLSELNCDKEKLLEKIKKCNKKELEKLDETIRSILIFSDQPRYILYTNNIEDELIQQRQKIQEDIQEKNKEYTSQKNKVESIEQKINELDKYIEDPEVTKIFDRIDKLNEFKLFNNMLSDLYDNYTMLYDNSIRTNIYNILDKQGIITKLNNLINNTFKNRCNNIIEKYEDNFVIKNVTDFDYRDKKIYYNGKSSIIYNISGGTDSVLTLLTLASTSKKTKLGLVLLVDEFNDVVGKLRRITLNLLSKKENVLFTFLVKPIEEKTLTFNIYKEE